MRHFFFCLFAFMLGCPYVLAADVPVTDGGDRASGQGFWYVIVESAPLGTGGISVDPANAPYPVKGKFWSENAGWISFDHWVPSAVATLVSTPDPDILSLTGFAWSENAGWIAFSVRGLNAANDSVSDPYFRISEWKFHGFGWSANLWWLDFSKLRLAWPSLAPLPANGMVFAADSAKPLNARDILPSFGPGYRAFVENWDSTAMSSYSSVNFIHDFRKAKPYHVEIVAPGGQIYEAIMNVVAATPSETPASSRIFPNAEVTRYEDDFSTPRTADGIESHSFEIRLRDKYGNAVVSVPGIKSVQVGIGLANDVDLDQIDPLSASPLGAGNYDLGDAVAYEWFGMVSGLLSNTGTQSNASNGIYRLAIKSHAPSKAGYPETTERNDVRMVSAKYSVTAETGFSGVGETSATPASVPASAMKFAPFAQVAWVTNTDDWKMRVGYESGFSASLTKLSTAPYSDVNVAVVLDAEGGNQLVSYQEPSISPRSKCVWYTKTIVALSESSYFSSWAELAKCDRSVFWSSTDVRSVSSLPTLENYEWTPKIVVAAPRNWSVGFHTELAYVVSGNAVAHPSWGKTFSSSDVDDELVWTTNQAVKIIGSVNAKNTAFDILQGNGSSLVGTMVKSKVRDSVRKNVENLTRNRSDFSGTDIAVFNGDYSLSSWPAGKRAVIVRNGNVDITSDVVFPDGTPPVAIIALADSTDKSKGNIRIDSSVKNLDAILYADGSLRSTVWIGDAADGPTAATNQLFIRGAVISNNTIGGSSITPVKCPALMQGDCTQATARRLDMNLFRFYKADPDGAGPKFGVWAPATGVPPEGADFPVVIQYVSGLQSDPPPWFKSNP